MDEVFYAQSGLSMFSGYMYGNPTHMHAPLVKYAIGLSQVLFGVSDVSIRAPIALIGIISVYAVYQVGRYVFDRLIGTVAAAFLSVLPVYNYYATMAMLDVPLALFVTLSFGTAVWWGRNPADKRAPTMLGVLTILTGATKVQGALYVIGALVFIVWIFQVVDEPVVTGRQYLTGSVVTFGAVYLPFVVSPSPTHYGGGSPPAVVRTLFEIPWIGNVGYAFAATMVQNLSHLGNGHRVVIFGQTYFQPPAWALLYWLGERGGFPFLFGIGAAITSVIARIGERAVRAGLISFLIIPLGIHTVLSVKLPRYLVPLYPLVAICASWFVVTFARKVSERVGETSVTWRQTVIVVLAVVLVVTSVPPSLLGMAVEDGIRTDTDKKEVSAVIANQAAATDQLTVIVTNPLVYRWYLGEHRVGNFSKDVHEPKTFHINSTPVRLVGVDANRLSTILNSKHTCLVVLPQKFFKVQEEHDRLRTVVNSSTVIGVYGELRVYETCHG